MYYKIFLILVITFASCVGQADAVDSRYRVELIVLSHLEHDQLPDEALALEDFSDALDFLTPPPVDEAAAVEADQGAEAGAVAIDAETADPREPNAGEEEPACAVIHVTEMGPEMEAAWQRLRRSRPFRPLQYLSWEQPGVPPFPALRMHDLEIVFTEDPWLDLREAAGNGAETAIVFGDTAPDPAVDAETVSGPLPSPILYYRLDGMTQLVRTRFLHLEVKVEIREPVFDPALAQAPAAPADSLPDQAPQPQPTSFLVHRLDQRRQVRTGRMEYFDGPVLGVLAFITEISDTVAGENPDL
jgi:hypothetical protein